MAEKVINERPAVADRTEIRRKVEGNPTPPGGAANAMLGIWLILTPVLWRHSTAEGINTFVVGALMVLFSVRSRAAPSVRFLNAIVAVWLLISAFLLPDPSVWTRWNNSVVALVAFVLSLMPWRARSEFRRLGTRAPA